MTVAAPPNAQRRRFTVQSCTYAHGLTAMKMADEYETLDDLRPNLAEALPFNSSETRGRYCSSLIAWAFGEGGLNPIGAKAWRAYGDEELVKQILRERCLAHYSAVGKFVLGDFADMAPGSEFPADAIENHLIRENASVSANHLGNFKLTMRDLGFIRKEGRKYAVCETALPQTAFLILLHYHLAPEPVSVSVSEIIAHPFWRYLGGRDESEVRAALSNAAAVDAISRYAAVDGLEQIATRFSLEEMLQRRIRLAE